MRTCDNHCEFCFIYQLPPGMRKSLYLKDDDYRLSFLYGNFTTLTRFTEADLERVVTEGLSPLHVSIHATDPEVRVEMLRNRRGATSLRWLRALLDHGIEVHGRSSCARASTTARSSTTPSPGCSTATRKASCASCRSACRVQHRARSRPRAEAASSSMPCDWQEVYMATLGRRLAFAADEYYLLADRPFPPAEHYGDFPMYEDGIGMARAFEVELLGGADARRPEDPDRGGFFRNADGELQAVARPPGAHALGAGCGAVALAGGDGSRSVDADYEPYRGPRGGQPVAIGPHPRAPVAVLTGTYGARVLAPLVARLGRSDVRVVPVENRYFGGNVGVAGLMVGEDLARVLAEQPAGHRYLLPDVCLTQGRFLDGSTPADLPRPVEVVPTDGRALRAALQVGDAAVAPGPVTAGS